MISHEQYKLLEEIEGLVESEGEAKAEAKRWKLRALYLAHLVPGLTLPIPMPGPDHDFWDLVDDHLLDDEEFVDEFHWVMYE